MKTLLTVSRMYALLRCPRFHYWRYEVGLRTETDAAPLRFGSAWHRAMEIRGEGGDLDAAFSAGLGECPLDEVQAATLGGMLAGYYQQYAQETIVNIRPEVEFRMPIDGSRAFDAAGKIDGLAALTDGRQIVLERKTVGESIEPDSDYWIRLRADKQLFQYVLAARALQYDPAICVYDCARKPCIRPRERESAEEYGQRLAADTAERPNFYFARREVPIIEQDLETFKIERIAIKDMILSLRQCSRRARQPADAWPRNVSSRTCGTCEFAGFCLNGISVDPAAPPAGFRVGPANNELSAAVTAD